VSYKLDLSRASSRASARAARKQRSKKYCIEAAQKTAPEDAIDAAAQMEQQPPTVNIAGVEVPIRGLPENDAPAASKKPPPQKQVLFCG